MEQRTEEEVPLLNLRCSIVTHLNTGIFNNAANQTIISTIYIAQMRVIKI